MQAADAIRQEVENECRKLFAAAEEFKNKLLDERKRLPYHINVIDELHINENGHSRILMQLLKFQNSKGEYEFLESLIHYIKQRHHSVEFERITINKPNITQEEARIDLWIRDKGYAIVFENKVYNAADQETQLSRYIDKTKECGYPEDAIFVVYLSQSGSDPAVQSWGDYEKTFKQRYVNLSFRYDILLWLKDYVQPNMHQKDFLLHSAVLQYIDYLEGLFYLRTTEKQMNMNLDNLIISQLDLKGKSDQKRINILQEKINDFHEIASKMQSLVETYKQNIRNNIIKEWKEETKQRFPDLNPNLGVSSSGEEAYTNVTFKLSDGTDVIVFIGYDSGNDRLYCQAEYIPNSEIKDTDAIMQLLYLLPDKYDGKCIYKYEGSWDNDYDAVYELFVKVVEKGKLIFRNK